MNVDKGETIAGTWVTPLIPQTGFYKLLAKRKKDGACEWVHFIQREDGTKKLLFRGEVQSKEELQKVVDVANNMLGKTFGPSVKLSIGKADMYSLDGRKFDDTVH